jgi:hypothetical protein
LHDFAHFLLGVGDAARDVAETFGESFRFAFEEVVACLGAFEFGFHYAEGLAGREDWFTVLWRGMRISGN